jgi:hypothetical protein
MISATKQRNGMRLVELILLRPFIEQHESLAQSLCYLALISAPALLWLVQLKAICRSRAGKIVMETRELPSK